MKFYINEVSFIRFLLLFVKLCKFEIQKCGQISCAHKPYFLMPGHICGASQVAQVSTRPTHSQDPIHKTLYSYIPIHAVYTM